MKSIYFFSFAVLCLFLSCKKDKNDDESYHISCKIDGTVKTFNTLTLAVKAKEDLYGLMISGRSGSTENPDVMGIVITSAEAHIAANTYTDEGTAYELLGGYHEAATSTDYGAGTEVNLEAISNGKVIVNHFSGDYLY